MNQKFQAAFTVCGLILDALGGVFSALDFWVQAAPYTVVLRAAPVL